MREGEGVRAPTGGSHVVWRSESAGSCNRRKMMMSARAAARGPVPLRGGGVHCTDQRRYHSRHLDLTAHAV